jgi:glyoxylase-like metal-dependent hydrolase (beta-lactamase superfamily II)
MAVQWLPGTASIGNSYVYEEILIDAGIQPMAVEPYRDSISTIVLTHCHYDHTAHVVEIARLCNAEIAIHQLDASALQDDLQSVALYFGERAPLVHPHRLLSGEEGVGPLTVLHTPGHTPGSICLFEEQEGILFSGDTVFSEGSFGRYDLPGGNFQALRQSVKKLADLKVEGLYPGHGFPIPHKGGRHIAAAHQFLESTSR